MTDLNVQIQSSTLPNVQAEPEKSTAEAREIQMPEALKAQYTYLEKLGKGSQGQVWLAERKSDGERVAIKQLNVHSVTTWKQYELFKREAGILESLNFEGVVPFYEYVEDLEAKPPFVCIIQKYIEGQTLAEMLKARHRFETDAIYDIIAQVLRILQKLHTHQPPVVHRDIKPSNLMLTPKENGRYQVTLLDFGAVANPQVQNGGSTVAGTFGYMPPEQLMGQAQPASDIYALAALAVELLSGTSPADIPVCDFKLVIEPHLTHVPVEVVQTLSMMLEPAMDNRICDHTALIAQFDALANKKQPSLLHFLHRTAVPKLEDVESICQPGNYEIWQNLDQKTDIALSKCPCHLDIPQTQNDIKDKDKLLKTKDKKHKYILLNIFIFILWLYLLLSQFIFFIDLMPLSVFKWFSPIFTVILLISLIVGIEYSALRGWTNFEPSQHRVNRLRQNVNWSSISRVLSEGQKVIGQVTAIYYLNSDATLTICPNKRREDFLITQDIPKFWVIYRFQYRDEQNLEFYGDLVTHTPPEGHYKVGTPIPCIAKLTDNDSDLSLLSVVPYPYPFGDVLDDREIRFTCAIDNKYLKTGDILGCMEQMQYYCLSSIRYDADTFYDDVVEIIPGRYLNDATACGFYEKLANLLEQRQDDDEAIFKAAELYRNKLNDKQSADKLYHQLIEHYTSQFKSGDDEAILKAAGIYRLYLDDKESAEDLGRPLLERYMQKFESGDDEAILKATEVCRDILADDIEYTNCHRLFAKRYLPKPDANADEIKSAIENYQSKLKYESERICWQMVVMIWMDDYGLTIEEIWDKLKDKYFDKYFDIEFYFTFKRSMLTAFSYFDEDWLISHKFSPQKTFEHICSWSSAQDDNYMKSLREIWAHKKQYQIGNKTRSFDIFFNYFSIFEAYSDAKIWALRYYDVDPREYLKKNITDCDEKIQSTVKG